MWQREGWGNELGTQTLQYLILSQSFPFNCPAFQKVPQARISRSYLTLASGHSVVVSSLNKEKEPSWLGEKAKEGGKGRQHLCCYVAVKIDEKVF